MINMLVVDDEYCVGMGISQTIEWDRYNINIVDIAYDGEEGLEMALEYKPEIIITDMRMPVMDGLQMIEKIREAQLNSYFIVLSGYDEFEYAKGAIECGVSAYLLKPIKNEELISKVCELVQKIQADRERILHEQNIRAQSDYFKELFLKKMLSQPIYDKGYLERSIKTLGITFKFDDYIVVTIQFRALANKEIARSYSIVELLKCVAQQLLRKGGTMQVIEMGIDKGIMILNPKQSDRKYNIKKLKHYCIDVLKARGIGDIQHLLIGVSELHIGCENLHKAYEEARAVYDLYANIEGQEQSSENLICSNRREIQLAFEYMKSHIDETIKVEDVANELYMSTSHLMHIFKQELGKTLLECLIDLRIDLAKELLVNPRYKVYEVANLVGYSDVKYFTKIFRIHVGVTPKSYAKKASDL